MNTITRQPFYDANKSYEENWQDGPFGAFGDGKKFVQAGPPERPESSGRAEEPQHSFLGQKVYLPFGIAAGPLVNGRFVKAALNKGFDLATYKTVRSKFYPCHPWPNVVPLKFTGDLTLEAAAKGLIAGQEFSQPLTITNSFGAPSFNPDVWQPDLRDAANSAQAGQVVIGSFQGTLKQGMSGQDYIADFTLAAKLVKETGVKLMEVNLSCPNEGTANLLCFDIGRVQKVVWAIKNEIGNAPLILKIAHFQDAEQLKQLVKAVGAAAQAFEAINTIPAEIRNGSGEQALPGKGRLISGVCGSAIKWAGLATVRNLVNIREALNLNYEIIGVGGVMGFNDYQNYLEAGASAVMSATGAMWNPYLAQEIKNQQ